MNELIQKKNSELGVENSRLERPTTLDKLGGVNDGTRTHDDWNHNPGLYQLSYAHHNTLVNLSGYRQYRIAVTHFLRVLPTR